MVASAVIGGATALIGASSSRKAARAGERAANDQMDLQREMFDVSRGDLAPYREGGGRAFNALMYEFGLGPQPVTGGNTLEVMPEQYEISPGSRVRDPRASYMDMDRAGLPEYTTSDPVMGTRYRVGDRVFSDQGEAQAFASQNSVGGTPYERWEFEETPGYQFRLDEGARAVEGGVAARQGLNSGAAMKALTRYGQNYATNEFNNERAFQFNALGQLANMGQSAAAGSANVAQNFAQQGSNAIANRGDAQMAGAIGFGNALTGGLNNGLGVWAYNQNRNQPVTPRNALFGVQPSFGGGR